MYKGFFYQNEYYEYSYDESGIIDGLNKDGVKSVYYTYNGCIPDKVYEISEEGNYADRTEDDEFIGNVNPIRYAQRYYEDKLGWYYFNSRYYSPQGERYIDGISEERALELSGQYPDFEIIIKTYTFGRPLPNNNKDGVYAMRNILAKLSPIELVTRVIYCESSQDQVDQICVAGVIRNRMGGITPTRGAQDVVLEPEQFEVVVNGTIYNLDPNSADVNAEMYAHAAELATSLVNNECVGKSYPRWFSNQVNFYSIGSFLEAQIVQNQIVKYLENGRWIVYDNCATVPTGPFTYYELQQEEFDLTPYASLKRYNVFCNATYYPR